MKLEWAELAVANRRAIYDYLDERNADAAAESDREIVNSTQRLRDYPNSGRPGRVDGTRELVVIGTPYIIAYHVAADRVRLLRVFHGAQLWPASFPGK